jgi:hypothetical protein
MDAMKEFKRLGRATVFIFALSAVLSSSAGALAHQFSEDFSTKLYCDSLNTTAWWDTVAGEIKLYPFELTLAGSEASSGAREVVVDGDYAYVAAYVSGLRVVDVSDPTSPTLVGSYNTTGLSRGVAVSGNYAYVADDGAGGVQVIDISNPSSPLRVGSYDTRGYASGIAVAGDYAYVADETYGLLVLDISNPPHADSAGSYDTPGGAIDVEISGDYAYVADRLSGLCVVDISDPTNPTFAGSYDTPDYALGVAVDGDYAYVADHSTGIVVLDISTPSSPALAGSYDTPGYAYGVTVSGDYAYVADEAQGIWVLNISNPAFPVLSEGYDTPGSARRLTVTGDLCYVADVSGGLQIIDVADPVLPPVLAGSCGALNGAGLAVSGNYAYVAEGYQLDVIDITDPTSPVIEGVLATPGDAYAVAVSGDHAFVAVSTGLLSIDISDPANPDSAGFWENVVEEAWIWFIAIAGDYAYLAGDSETSPGFYVIDISDPSNPSQVAAKTTPSLVRGLAVSGDYLYVTAWCQGLIAYDISNPASPDSVGGGAFLNGCHNGLAVSGDYAFVSTTHEIEVIDISNPLAHSVVGTYDTNSETGLRIALAGDYAYVAARDYGLMVIEISDPTNPTLAGRCDTPHFARDVCVAGDHAFVADAEGGLQVIQIFERDSNLDSNDVRSLVVFDGTDEISAVKLTPTGVGSINWYVSADSGASWDSVPGDAEWFGLESMGDDLLWRAELDLGTSGVSPVCSQLDMEWLYSRAEIDSVHDVLDDQGGWVRVRFDRSGLDVGGGAAGARATGYYVHRRIDDVLLARRVIEEGERLDDARPVLLGSDEEASENMLALPSSVGGARGYVLDDRYYLVSDESVTGGFPDGIWEAIGRIPATQELQYYSLAPSVGDSGAVLEYTVFCVSTHTTDPDVYYFSSPDSGYSVDNLAPAMPQDIAGLYSYPPPELLITWRPNFEADLSHYAVYKGVTPGFVPDVGNRIGEPTDTFLVDVSFDPNVDNYYKVSALDIHWNESDFALLGPDGISGVGETPPAPEVTLLEQNVPNPFNPVTTIRFAIAKPGWVVLRVYNVAGRPVRTLVKGRREIDRYEATWDGRDDGGRLVASGVYLYELDAPGYLETKKMVLVR